MADKGNKTVKRKRRVRRSPGERLFDALNVTFFIIVAVIMIFPFWNVISISLTSNAEFMSKPFILFPEHPTLEAYKYIFSTPLFPRAYGITFIITLSGTFLSTLVTSMLAYGLSKKTIRGYKFFMIYLLITMFFSGGIVPMYLLLRVIGLYDSFWVYILPSVFSVYNMLIVSNFYKGIPDSLYEAAELDGAGELRIWALIYMPLSKPVLATVALWIAVDHWNSYMGTMLYTEAGEWTITLQFYLKHLINEASSNSGAEYSDQVTARTVSYAGIIVALIPIMCFYPFIQKHFTKGIMIGSLKG